MEPSVKRKRTTRTTSAAANAGDRWGYKHALTDAAIVRATPTGPTPQHAPGLRRALQAFALAHQPHASYCICNPSHCLGKCWAWASPPKVLSAGASGASALNPPLRFMASPGQPACSAFNARLSAPHLVPNRTRRTSNTPAYCFFAIESVI